MHAFARQSSAAAPESSGGAATRFGDLLEQRVTTPVLRNTWQRDVAMIAGLYQRAQELDALSLDAPMVIVDLAPGNGARAWHLWRELRGCWPMLRMVLACRDQLQLRALRSHPAMEALLENGFLEIVELPQGEAAWCAVLGEIENPVVVLAHGAFEAGRHDLRACHYGTWIEAWAEPDKQTLTWKACEEDEALSALYREGINSAAFLVPTGAFACLAPLLRACRGRYYLMASDRGAHRMADIRLGALAADLETLQAPVLPVNFHALAAWLRVHGATCASELDVDDETSDWPLVWHASALDDACPALAGHFASSLCGALAGTSSRDAWRGFSAHYGECLATGQLGAEHAMTIWRASEFAPEVLCALAGGLIAQAERIHVANIPQWKDALVASCAQYYAPERNDGFFFAAAHLASTLGLWALAARLIEEADAYYGSSVDMLRMRSWCMQACGESAEALGLLESNLTIFPGEARLESDAAALRQRLSEWQALSWYEPIHAKQGALMLEPISESHAEACFHQYRDSQIAMMTRLPELPDLAAVSTWIAGRRSEAGRIEYALIHEAFGFVGVLSAHRIGEDAFFHFWIGTDFQGQGWAAPALQMFMAQLAHAGVRRIFSAVYPDNIRSLKSLQREGFAVLPVRARPPEEEMLFVSRSLGGASEPIPTHVAALRTYCMNTGGVFEFAEDETSSNSLRASR